jgi:GH15 family glucan-1,4-alpha-glucosidase
MPPFTDRPSADVVNAWRRYQVDAMRPAGGLAPGVSWKQDGISWTPETALVALAAASDGDSLVAAHWLDWLGAHRTSWGSLPEKVNSDGTPGGPAPLAWTAASVILAVAALDANGASTTS